MAAVAALATDISRDAKDYVCRKLAMVGSATAVSAIAGLLPNEGNSHLARHALERIPGAEAAAALASAAIDLSGKLKLGAIGSLGVRGEDRAVTTLTSLLKEQDAAVVRAAALSLGAIGGNASAKALQTALKAASADTNAVIDGLLSCAESLLSQKKADEATTIYQSLSGDNQPRLVRLAATRGLLSCAEA
jgi:HEAT repeat protein